MKKFHDQLMDQCTQCVGTAIFTERKHTLWWSEQGKRFVITEEGITPSDCLLLGSALPWEKPLGTGNLDDEIALQEKQELDLYEDICDKLNLAK
jgi:hypothetical protein